jgi:alpha-N-arabinofuranosidase
MGVRQTESDFEYRAQMQFAPDGGDAEAGISVFQKDDNYLNLTIVRENGRVSVRLVLAEPQNAPRVIEEVELRDYTGEVSLAAVSRDGEYLFSYALGDREEQPFATIGADLLLARGNYTGAFVGVYASTNGGEEGPYADFDWVKYVGHARP